MLVLLIYESSGGAVEGDFVKHSSTEVELKVPMMELIEGASTFCSKVSCLNLFAG